MPLATIQDTAIYSPLLQHTDWQKHEYDQTACSPSSSYTNSEPERIPRHITSKPKSLPSCRASIFLESKLKHAGRNPGTLRRTIALFALKLIRFKGDSTSERSLKTLTGINLLKK